MKTFSERLSLLMDERQETQESLARKLSVAGSSVSRWQSGSLPHKSKSFALASVLGVNAAWLMTGEGERDPVNQPAGESLAESAADRPQECGDPELLGIFGNCAEHLPAAIILEVISYLQERPELCASALIKRLLDFARSKL